MAETEIKTGLEENTIGAIERFADIAATDPISALLILVGALLVGFSAGLFGVVTAGAVLSTIKRGLSSSEAQPH
jgi:hypothetical protein